MLTRLSTPDAFWSCPELGVMAFTRLAPSDPRGWGRDDFDDAAVSRAGIALQVMDGAWAVSNRSTSMTDVYLYDLRYGRRAVPPSGALRPRRLRSWILLPSTVGPDDPHVIAVRIDVPPAAAPQAGGGAEPDARWTQRAGEPAGPDLRRGLRAAARILEDPDDAHILATFARPWFEMTTRAPEPADARAVTACLPWARHRAGRLLTAARAAVWGRAQGQPLEVLIRLLVQHHVLTYDHVRAVPHRPGCGHVAAQIDPNASCRRW